MDRSRRLSLHKDKKIYDLIAQHSAVVDALEERNVGGAVQALRHHLRVVLADIAQMRTENPGLFARPLLGPTLTARGACPRSA